MTKNPAFSAAYREKSIGESFLQRGDAVAVFPNHTVGSALTAKERVALSCN